MIIINTLQSMPIFNVYLLNSLLVIIKFDLQKLEPIQELLKIIQSKTKSTELDWITSKSALDLKGISLAFVSTPRFISKTTFSLDLNSIVQGWTFEQIGLDQLVRIYFIALMAEKSESENQYCQQINLLFDTAEMNEAVALYAALPVFVYPEKWLSRATDAVRSNIGHVFDAIAFGNPYPYQYFSELAWNQLVLKCIFNDKPIHQIFGLEQKVNQHLADTLSDFAHERWAANRRVPSQVWRLIVHFITPKLVKDLEKLVHSSNERDVLAAKMVINNSNSPLLIELKQSYLDSNLELNWHLLEIPEPIYTA